VNLADDADAPPAPDGSFERPRQPHGVRDPRAARRGPARPATAPSAARRVDRRQQNRDGGWNFAGRGAPSGIDDTAGALQALSPPGARAAAPSPAARASSRARQNPDGGFPLTPGRRFERRSRRRGRPARSPRAATPSALRRSGVSHAARLPATQVPADGSVRTRGRALRRPVWVTARRSLGARPPAVSRSSPRRCDDRDGGPTARVDPTDA
jgi:energy-coupling factor transport system substrate-specific component